MKVYVVVGDNGQWYDRIREWNCDIFTSKESAERYIQEQPDRFNKDWKRIVELRDTSVDRRLSSEERKELMELTERWPYCMRAIIPTFRIEEFELLE